jgi:hypothetical protein
MTSKCRRASDANRERIRPDYPCWPFGSAKGIMESVVLDYKVPAPGAPTSLKVVAWIFIMTGVLTIVQAIIDLTHSRITFATGFLAAFVGPGLLRFSSGWRTFALVLLWFGMILTPVILAFMLLVTGEVTVDFFGLHVGSVPRVVAFVLGAALYVLTIWQYRILVREDVRLLFGLPPRS